MMNNLRWQTINNISKKRVDSRQSVKASNCPIRRRLTIVFTFFSLFTYFFLLIRHTHTHTPLNNNNNKATLR